LDSEKGLDFFTRMAIHTPAGLGFLGLGLIAFSWKNEREKIFFSPSWLPFIIPIGITTATFFLWVHIKEQVHFFLSLAMRIRLDSFPESEVNQYCYRNGFNPEFVKSSIGPKHFFPSGKVYDDHIAQKEMSILDLQSDDKEAFLYESTLARIKEFLRLDSASDSEVGRRLGFKRQSMEAYKKKGYFPASRVVTFCQTNKVSVDWVLNGDGGFLLEKAEVQKIKDELLGGYRENSELKSRTRDLENKVNKLEKGESKISLYFCYVCFWFHQFKVEVLLNIFKTSDKSRKKIEIFMISHIMKVL
jgi:hypothetical protein